ncbi:hypothetical protein E2562_006044 [Oryza meyeriana var. granulata]|uniref:Uncharacterized protein n=1 Tax=Oryza meyeriana var. granulata TaxID=110450 RepID=A0A6G1EVB4_9ORYZ|nr:hypothetical protein E2562_006044 [Oryza meyeriana var. granulata]
MKFCTDEVTGVRVYGRNVVVRARQVLDTMPQCALLPFVFFSVSIACSYFEIMSEGLFAKLPFDRYSSFLVTDTISQSSTPAMWFFNRKGPSGFSGASTAEEVTAGVDGRGLVAVITGASSGIGLETARVLALRSVHVVMAVRKVAAGLKASEAIRAEIAGAKVHVLELDLSSMDSVRRFASEFDSLNLPLNILINNAGILAKNCTRSIDGLELHFATNHIGHFLLTNLLLENMKNASRESGVEGRIINVSSSGHIMTYPEGICFDKVKDPSRFWTYIAYGQSKLANILHSIELARILKCDQGDDVNILTNAIHPGVVGTNLFKHRASANAVVNSIGRIVRKTVEQGAATTCYVALHPQVTRISGKYFSNCNLETPSSQASNSELAKKLWEFSTKEKEENDDDIDQEDVLVEEMDE